MNLYEKTTTLFIQLLLSVTLSENSIEKSCNVTYFYFIFIFYICLHHIRTIITIQSGSREVTSSSEYTQLPFVNNNYWIECSNYAIYSRTFHTAIITDTSLQKMSYTYCSYSL